MIQVKEVTRYKGEKSPLKVEKEIPLKVNIKNKPFCLQVSKENLLTRRKQDLA